MKALKSLVLSLVLLICTPFLSAASEPVYAPIPPTTAQILTNQARAQAALDAYWAGLQSKAQTNSPTAKSSNAAAPALPSSPTKANVAPAVVPAKASATNTTTQQQNVTVVVVQPSEASSSGNPVKRVFEASSNFVKNHVGIDVAILLSALALAIFIEWKRVSAFFTTLIKIFTTPKPVPAPKSPTVPSPVITGSIVATVTETAVIPSIPAGNPITASVTSGSAT